METQALPIEYRGISPEVAAIAARRELARRHMIDFTCYTFPQYKRAAHNELIAGTLDDWIAGLIPFLMILTPPRAGKTELVSRRMPGKIFGKFPEAQIIATSYAASLAFDNSRKAKRVMRSSEYRELFPDVRLSEKRGDGISDQTEEWETNQGGIYRCAGVGGGITGRGMDFGLIDDPFKDRAEAESETIREKVWDWYTSTFYTRQMPGARFLIIMTRWHEDDLAGRLLQAMENDPLADQWVVLDLKALAEKGDILGRQPGEALWPERFPREKLLSIKANMGTYDWDALYQQRPNPPGGSKIKRDWFKIVDRAPEGLRWVRYWDLAVSAKESADYTTSVALAMGQDNNIYIRDMIRDQWEWPQTRRVIRQTAKIEPIPQGVEEAGQQKGFISDLQSDPEMRHVAVYAVPSDSDKLTRALPWIAKAEAGKVHLVSGPWVNEFLNECQKFTGVNDKHDDQVDVVSGGYTMLSEGLMAPPVTTSGGKREMAEKSSGF